MKKLIIVFSLIAGSVVGQQYEIHPMTKISVDRELSLQIFDNINEHRDSLDRKSFEWSEELYKQSKDHALNLIQNSKWGHWGDPTVFTFEILNMIDLRFTNLENPNSYQIGAHCVKGWSESDGHRGSLESPIKTKETTSAKIKCYGVTFTQKLSTKIGICVFHATSITNGQEWIFVICRSL
tara:strand:+ start:596 stop:1138 length:543 start_codon:yes stop_codon:yes gene_type:complete